MQTQLQNTVSLPELVDLVRKEFVTNSKMVQPAAKQLFITDNIGKGQGNTKRYDEVDIQTYARLKRQGEATKKASVGVGYNVTMTKKRIAMEIDITQEMLDENRFPEIGSQIRALTHFCPQRTELDLTHILTFASATSYTDMDGETVTLTVGDGLALASASHTLKYSSTTYSNRVSGDPIFSQGALESAEQLTVTNIYSNFGERRVMNFNTVVTSDDPNTVNAVKQILQSTADIDGAHAGVANVNKSKYRHIVLPQLATTATGAHDSTKAKYWMLAAAGQGTDGWQAFFGNWESPHMKEPKGDSHDYSRDVDTYGVRAGYGIRAVTGRGIIFSLAT